MSKANVSLGNFEAVEEFTENDNFSTSIYEQDYKGLLIARCNQNGRYPEHARAILEGLNGKKLALDEITRLHAEIAALRAENERLRTALMPFADAAAAYDGMPPPKYFGDTDFELRYSGSTKTTVTVGQLRDARAALTPQQGEAGE